MSSLNSLSQEPEADRTQTRQAKWTAEDAQAACEAFLAVYPKTTSTGDVEAWFRAKPVTLDLQREMVSAVNRIAVTHDWTKDSGKWIPAPIKWLNGKRWKDQPIKVRRRLVL